MRALILAIILAGWDIELAIKGEKRTKEENYVLQIFVLLMIVFFVFGI